MNFCFVIFWPTDRQTCSTYYMQAWTIVSWLTNRHPVDLTRGHTVWRITLQDDWFSLVNHNRIKYFLWEFRCTLSKKKKFKNLNQNICMMSLIRTCQRFHAFTQRSLTGNYDLNLLRHGSSKHVGSKASIFTLELEEVLVVKHNSTICVVGPYCWDVRQD